MINFQKFSSIESLQVFDISEGVQDTCPLPTLDRDMMLSFKYYCPRTGKMHDMSYMYVPITANLSSVLPKLCAMANISLDSMLVLWEEIEPNMFERIDDTNQPLEHLLEELKDGHTIVFQQVPGPNHRVELGSGWDLADKVQKYKYKVHLY